MITVAQLLSPQADFRIQKIPMGPLIVRDDIGESFWGRMGNWVFSFCLEYHFKTYLYFLHHYMWIYETLLFILSKASCSFSTAWRFSVNVQKSQIVHRDEARSLVPSVSSYMKGKGKGSSMVNKKSSALMLNQVKQCVLFVAISTLKINIGKTIQ